MRTLVCIIIALFVCSPQLKAGDTSLENAIEKDIDESLGAILSVRTIDSGQTGRKDKINAEANRLIDKYGTKLVCPMKQVATNKITSYDDVQKISLAIRVLVQLGKSDPNSVRQAFLDLIKDPDSHLRDISVYALAEINKEVARDVAVSAMKTTENPMVKASIIPLLGVVGDPNTLLLLTDIAEDSDQKETLKKVASQAKEYLEHRKSLPSEADRKSWEEQAFVYWLFPKEVGDWGYITEKQEYFRKAELLAERGYRFSLDFLRYHLEQKDPLAAAIIGVQKEIDAVEDLEKYVSEDAGKPTIFTDLCRIALYLIKDKDKEMERLEKFDRRGRPIERTE